MLVSSTPRGEVAAAYLSKLELVSRCLSQAMEASRDVPWHRRHPVPSRIPPGCRGARQQTYCFHFLVASSVYFMKHAGGSNLIIHSTLSDWINFNEAEYFLLQSGFRVVSATALNLQFVLSLFTVITFVHVKCLEKCAFYGYWTLIRKLFHRL